MRKYLKYLSYVVRHRYCVGLECFKCGLYMQGILHDWSKFLPSEFIPYANFFAGGRKQKNDETGYYKPTETGDAAFDFAWFLHLKRNRHHWQYWILPGEMPDILPLKIPEKYLVEMVCDWVGAAKAQGASTDVAAWFIANRAKMNLHPESEDWIEDELRILLVPRREPVYHFHRYNHTTVNHAPETG